ncbi:MAG: hypothetical protein ACOVN5_08590 [Aquidulcibacter sp.]
METLTFQTPEEARAWDMYVAGLMSSGKGMSYQTADAMILERRKRMAPEEVAEPEREWTPHKPGDPMPCGPYVLIEYRYLGLERSYLRHAHQVPWKELDREIEWRLM